jgi:hypothetical protein
VCYNCDKDGHSIAQCPYKKKEEDNEKKKKFDKGYKKTRNSQRRSLIGKLMLVKNETQVMRILSQKVMTQQPSL